MKLLIYFLLFIILNTFSFSFELTSQEKEWLKNNKTIDVYFINPNRSYFYKDINNKTQGIYKELFKSYEKSLNIKFNFIDTPKNTLTKLVNEGIPKIAFNVTKTAEREKDYTFLDSLVSYNIIGLYTKNSLNLNNLNSQKIGLIKNTSQSVLMKKYYPNLNYVFVNSYEEGFKELQSKNIDILVSKTIDDYSNKYYHYDFTNIPKSYLQIAINKNAPELESIVKNIIQSFYKENLGEKIVPVARESYLKYFFKDKDFFNDIKREYSKLKVLIPNHNIYPFFYKNNGLYSGYAINRLEEFSNITSIPIEYTHNANSDYDIRIVDSEASSNELFIAPYYNANTAVFSNQENYFIDSLDQIKDSKIGVISIRNSLKNTPFITTNHNTIIRYHELSKALKDLANGKIDYFMGDYRITTLEINALGLENKIHLSHVNEAVNRIGFGMNDQNLYKFFNSIVPTTSLEQDVINKIFIKPDLEFKDYKLTIAVSTVSGLFIIFLIFLYKRTKKISNNYKQILNALVDSFEKVNEISDTDTGSHILRVNLYSELLAKKLNCPKKFTEDISRYSSLHDLGKIGISDAILKKPGKLTHEEFEEIKKHSVLGFDLVSRMKIGTIAENIALSHHEKWDGTGYPYGLKGENIPLEARIVALADVYDALRQSRVYKEGFSHEKAMGIIFKDSGKHFDPKIVDVFIRYNKEFKEIFDNNN